MENANLKIIFMATSGFAIPSLEKLSISNHQIVKVITTPDSQKGRGLKIYSSPVKDKTISLKLPLLQPENIKTNSFLEELKQIEADIGVVISYGKILPSSLINLPRYGCINIHGSLLPKLRGAAPIQWAIINGETETGVTSIFMNAGIDTGDIILQKKMDILPCDTAETLHNKLSVLGGELLIETLEIIESGNYHRRSQDNKLSSYARILTKEDGKINWNDSDRKIINLIRGATPWPGAYSFLLEKKIKIHCASLYEDIKIGQNYEPGEIFKIEKNIGIVVKTGNSAILIKELQPENKKRMSAYDFVLGHNIKPGQSFSM